MTPRSLASFDADTPPVPAEAARPTEERPPDPAPPAIRLEPSSLRSLEARRNRWIRERLERDRRATALADAAPPAD